MHNSTIITKKKQLKCGHFDFNFSKGRCKSCASLDSAKKRAALANDAPKVRKIGVAEQDPEFAKQVVANHAAKEAWFKLIRSKLTGTCQCGCGTKSQKNDDMYFRSSCCHIFPKKKFLSVRYHPLNYVERAFWGGCHGVMDDTSMDRWPGMADWDDIKAKFFQLEPLLTEEEKKTKFYTQLRGLVYGEQYLETEI